MKIARILIAAISTFICSASFAADPSYDFHLNSNSKSFSFKLENFSDNDIQCEKISVTADIYNRDCTKIITTYRFFDQDVNIKAGTKVINPNFGIDYLYYMTSQLKSKELAFCDSPKVFFNCK